MNFNITHQLESDIKMVLLPIAGKETLKRALPVLRAKVGISEELLLEDFSGKEGENVTFYHSGRRLVLIGIGEAPGFATLLKVFRQFSHKNKSRLPAKTAISFLFENTREPFSESTEAMINGLLLGGYQIGKFKTKDEQIHPLLEDSARLDILVEPEKNKEAKLAAERAIAIATTQTSIFDLVNAPSNKKNPAVLGKWALDSALKYGYKARVMDKDQIVKLGFEALLAVNRGSEYPPVFIVLEYDGTEGEGGKTIGLVGKGVTFDTGGLSLKPSANMHYMKSDMGGAAAVFGAVESAAKLKLPVRIIGIVPATDNSIGANAIKPSDVIDSYSGKTIEVIDTDAEGRLILADGIAYMIEKYKPEILIDLATLTGSAVRTLGYNAAALFSNNDELADHLSKAGERTGERVWRLPIWEVYHDDMKSDVADIKNFSGKPLAGAITAAKFLEFFTDKHPTWAHLDIAGVAFRDSEFASQKSATAFGVRLLVEFIKSQIKQPTTVS